MTKKELISALEWFKDDSEVFVRVYHPAVTGVYELVRIAEAAYSLPPYEQCYLRCGPERVSPEYKPKGAHNGSG